MQNFIGILYPAINYSKIYLQTYFDTIERYLQINRGKVTNSI